MTPASGFKDHFSTRSEQYARFRPTYPAALYEALAERCTRTRRAWDCATGSGQVAVALASHFDSVIATDASAQQIAAATPHPNVDYRTAPAERSGLDDSAVDLITVAQALHWFDTVRFAAEAERVAGPGCLLAVWCYGLAEVTRACDAVIRGLYAGVVDAYWPPERVHIENGYRDIELPGKPLPAPGFAMRLEWDADAMLGYLRTWSAVKRCEAAEGRDPVAGIEAPLRAAWGDGPRPVRWPLTLRLCRL